MMKTSALYRTWCAVQRLLHSCGVASQSHAAPHPTCHAVLWLLPWSCSLTCFKLQSTVQDLALSGVSFNFELALPTMSQWCYIVIDAVLSTMCWVLCQHGLCMLQCYEPPALGTPFILGTPIKRKFFLFFLSSVLFALFFPIYLFCQLANLLYPTSIQSELTQPNLIKSNLA